MTRNVIVFFTLIFIASCSQNNSNSKEIKEKEPVLKEPELAQNEINKSSDETSSQSVPNTKYKSYHPCAFTVSLPENFEMKAMYSDESLDYCDYSVTTKDGFKVLELHSLLNTRFGFDLQGDFLQGDFIEKAFNFELKESKLNITYKSQHDNWFVISGTMPENGNILYWKRVFGESFISDLYIEYPKSRALDIEPYIGTISKTFVSN